jgi:hypothetical protein
MEYWAAGLAVAAACCAGANKISDGRQQISDFKNAPLGFFNLQSAIGFLYANTPKPNKNELRLL